MDRNPRHDDRGWEVSEQVQDLSGTSCENPKACPVLQKQLSAPCCLLHADSEIAAIMRGPVVQKSHCCFVHPRYLPSPCQASPVGSLHPPTATHREGSVSFCAGNNFVSQSLQTLRKGAQYLLITFLNYKDLVSLKFALQVPL